MRPFIISLSIYLQTGRRHLFPARGAMSTEYAPKSCLPTFATAANKETVISRDRQSSRIRFVFAQQILLEHIFSTVSPPLEQKEGQSLSWSLSGRALRCGHGCLLLPITYIHTCRRNSSIIQSQSQSRCPALPTLQQLALCLGDTLKCVTNGSSCSR